MRTMNELLKAWGVPHEVAPVARLARVLHRHATRIERKYRFYNPADVKRMKFDASDLLTYARELKSRASH